jgi:hypothetical protein
MSLDNMQQAMMREDKRKVHGYNEVLDKQPPLKSIKNVNSEYAKFHNFSLPLLSTFLTHNENVKEKMKM